jgi:hypothetical protein
MAGRTQIEEKESDTSLPDIQHISNPKMFKEGESFVSTGTSANSSLERTIVIHNTSVNSVPLPFNAQLEAKRLSNLIANRGSEPSKPSTPEK